MRMTPAVPTDRPVGAGIMAMAASGLSVGMDAEGMSLMSASAPVTGASSVDDEAIPAAANMGTRRWLPAGASALPGAEWTSGPPGTNGATSSSVFAPETISSSSSSSHSATPNSSATSPSIHSSCCTLVLTTASCKIAVCISQGLTASLSDMTPSMNSSIVNSPLSSVSRTSKSLSGFWYGRSMSFHCCWISLRLRTAQNSERSTQPDASPSASSNISFNAFSDCLNVSSCFARSWRRCWSATSRLCSTMMPTMIFSNPKDVTAKKATKKTTSQGFSWSTGRATAVLQDSNVINWKSVYMLGSTPPKCSRHWDQDGYSEEHW
mmetsp:Transcript_84509/g.244051  ORF Transcript_84509/g.244051 Transcript_84509/m.244051 type:complete len:322 (+) Transcript_84509:334-1299(+)